MRALLQADNVSIQFHTSQSTVQAVRGVSFSLYEGETLAIVGESGCGKSVLCKSILRLLPHSGAISNGKLLFQGQDLTALSEKAMDRIRGREIAMVFQDPMTSPQPHHVRRQANHGGHLTARKGFEKRGQGARAFLRWKPLAWTIRRPALPKCPHQFSGGMRQRAVIAMALACQSQAAHRRRAHHRAGCDHPGPDLELFTAAAQSSFPFPSFSSPMISAWSPKWRTAWPSCMRAKSWKPAWQRKFLRDPKHPYTWGLLGALPGRSLEGQPLYSIPGMPPDLAAPPVGDAFAQRNPYALVIDYQEQPPMFAVTPTHSAATWLLDSRAPEVPCPLAREVKNHG